MQLMLDLWLAWGFQGFRLSGGQCMIAAHETLAAGKPHLPMLAMLETLDNCLQKSPKVQFYA